MSTDKSFIYGVIRRIRAALEEPDIDAKYDDAYLLRDIVCPSMVDVVSRINNTSQSQVIHKFTITLAEDTEEYRLPPCVQEVVRLVVVNTDGSPIQDIAPRDLLNRHGYRWRLEGPPGAMTLVIQEGTSIDDSIEVWYVSNGDFWPHYVSASANAVIAADAKSMTVETSPTLGIFDDRMSAYVGGVLRIFGAGTSAFRETQERVIKGVSRTGADWTVSWDVALTTSGGSSSATYEIVPGGLQALIEAVAMRSAVKLAAMRAVSEKRMAYLRTEYKMALKTVGDNLTAMQRRNPPGFRKNTLDREGAQLGWYPW